MIDDPDMMSKTLEKTRWPLETVQLRSGRHKKRIRSSVFFLSAIFSFLYGMSRAFSGDVEAGFFILLSVTPFLFIYPVVRFLFGGRDSVVAVIATVVVDEVIKSKIISNLEKKNRRK